MNCLEQYQRASHANRQLISTALIEWHKALLESHCDIILGSVVTRSSVCMQLDTGTSTRPCPHLHPCPHHVSSSALISVCGRLTHTSGRNAISSDLINTHSRPWITINTRLQSFKCSPLPFLFLLLLPLLLSLCRTLALAVSHHCALCFFSPPHHSDVIMNAFIAFFLPNNQRDAAMPLTSPRSRIVLL